MQNRYEDIISGLMNMHADDLNVNPNIPEVPESKTMEIGQPGIDLIKSFETFQPKAYKHRNDPWSIGYGHTRTAKRGMEITEEEGQKLLRKDLSNAENEVRRLVKVPLTQNQYDALVSFEFNTGGLRYNKNRRNRNKPREMVDSTLLKRLNKGDYESVREEMLRWPRKKGFERGLLRRRNAEIKLFYDE